MKTKIIRITNQDAYFYRIMGPYLANRAVSKEIGYNLYDDPGKVWFVAVIQAAEDAVAGFCYLQRKDKAEHHYDIGSCYYRDGKTAVLKSLISAAVKEVKAGTITMTVKRNGRLEVAEELGFAIGRELKNFVEYVKEVGDAQ
jgi:RimJ/RimL family protein N-acetyltransferase